MKKKSEITPKVTTLKTVSVSCTEKRVLKNKEGKKHHPKQGVLAHNKNSRGKYIVKSRGYSRINTNARGGGAEGGGGTSGFAP